MTDAAPVSAGPAVLGAAGAPILEIEALTKSFGGIQAIDGVSLNVKDGEILGIVGPNGAGKTVLINMVSGFYRPTSGSIRFFGETIDRLPLHKIGRLGIARTFQNIRLFTRMTALENVLTAIKRHTTHPILAALAYAPSRQGLDEAMELLDLMGLTARANQSAGELPYGDARRLEIARALATEPKLLLLDEPAAGMNEQETSELIEDIQKVRHRLRAIALIEHDMTLIRALSDRIIAMNYGRVVAEGPAAEVLAHPEVVESYLGTEDVDDDGSVG
jgi:branched-chain amino acid transport system ATP-binding protein